MSGMRGMDVRDQALQRAFGAERGEVRDLRLEAADEFGGGVDDGAAEVEHRVGVVGEAAPGISPAPGRGRRRRGSWRLASGGAATA